MEAKHVGGVTHEGQQGSTLAVIIVSYNTRDLLRAALEATSASLSLSPEIDASVWVVDNRSTDGSAQMVADESPEVHLLPSVTNLGFAGGNNLALKALGYRENRAVIPEVAAVMSQQPGFWERSGLGGDKPELVLLLNSDAAPLGDAIGQMAHYLLAHPSAGGVGAQLQYPDGAFQHGAFAFPGLWQLLFDLFPPRPRRLLESRLNGRYPRAWYAAGHPFAVDFVLGAALMVRREAIEAVGLLDGGYFMYAEEVDWCWRMQRAGWPFFCLPAARVIHHGGASTRQFRAKSLINLWRSRQRLYRRFYSPIQQLWAGVLVRLGMQAEIRRLRAALARAEISAAEAEERIAAARQVIDIFAASA